MDRYFYIVKAIIVEDGEERNIIESHQGHDLYVERSNAFDTFGVLASKYLDQVKGSYSPLETYIKISFIHSYDTWDYEDGIKIELENQQEYPFYKITEGIINKDIKSFDFELKVLIEQGVVDENKSISELYNYTTENSTIKDLTKKLASINEKNRRSKYTALECTRCGKKMEIEKKIAMTFINRKDRKYNIWLSCRNCIAGYFNISNLYYGNYEVYDYTGKSVLANKPDLLDKI